MARCSWDRQRPPFGLVSLNTDVTVFVHATPQTPPWHVSPAAHEDGPHWPHASHVCSPAAPHCVVAGVQTGERGHEHAPYAQLAPQLCVPYVLHICELPGAQPCSAHVPSCQTLLTHDCVSVPQLPQLTLRVCPDRHATQLPAEHTLPEPHDVPAATSLQEDVLMPGWQLWHALPGFEAPEVTTLPLMSHCVPHMPEAQTWPLPQPIPSATVLKDVTLSIG